MSESIELIECYWKYLTVAVMYKERWTSIMHYFQNVIFASVYLR